MIRRDVPKGARFCYLPHQLGGHNDRIALNVEYDAWPDTPTIARNHSSPDLEVRCERVVVTKWPEDSLDADRRSVPPGEGHGWIQWKGTSVCMDVHCRCGHMGHIDASFAYFYRCIGCDKTFAMGTTVRLYECSPAVVAAAQCVVESKD